MIETHSRELTKEVIRILCSRGLKVVDISRVKRTKVVKNILLHFSSFISVESKYNYSTIKQIWQYLIYHSSSPVAADNLGSEQRLLFAFKP